MINPEDKYYAIRSIVGAKGFLLVCEFETGMEYQCCSNDMEPLKKWAIQEIQKPQPKDRRKVSSQEWKG